MYIHSVETYCTYVVHNNTCMCIVIIDVITIERTGENFRLIYDMKGRFAVHRITPEEAKVQMLHQCVDSDVVYVRIR